MPQLTDLTEVRVRLEHDRAWSAFSLADLDEPYARHAQWFGPQSGDALVLVYGAFAPPIVYIQGSGETCEETLAEPTVRARTGSAWLNVLPDHRAVVQRQFASFDSRRMVRMLLDPVAFHPTSTAPAGLARLGPADLEELTALYAGDRPAFFMPSQLEDGVYYAVREGGHLASVAGTHVVSAAGSVGALGNVYTRPELRGRGLAAAVTTAVTHELLARGISTIVLNIVATNEVARRVYERIGFREYCVYEEGTATR